MGVAPFGRILASLLFPGIPGVGVAPLGTLLTLEFDGIPGVELFPVSSGCVLMPSGISPEPLDEFCSVPPPQAEAKAAVQNNAATNKIFLILINASGSAPQISSAGLSDDPPEDSGRKQTGTGRLYQTGFGR